MWFNLFLFFLFVELEVHVVDCVLAREFHKLT